jgi:hypothetical protein
MEMGVLDEAKNVIPLKFLRKINFFFFPLVNSIRGHIVYQCDRVLYVKNICGGRSWVPIRRIHPYLLKRGQTSQDTPPIQTE